MIKNKIEEYDDNRLFDLLNEVEEVMTSADLFCGNFDTSSIVYDIGRKVLLCRVCSAGELYNAISTKREKTPYTLLDDFVIDNISSYYIGLSSYFHQQFTNKIDDFINEVYRKTITNPQIERFADVISQETAIIGESKRTLFSHIKTTLSRHIAAIIQSRALTFSKRCSQTELLLIAYKKGLYPFGWEFQNESKPEALLCYNCVYPQGVLARQI